MFYWFRYLKYLITYGCKNTIETIVNIGSSIKGFAVWIKESVQGCCDAVKNNVYVQLFIKLLKEIWIFLTPWLVKLTKKHKEEKRNFKKRVEAKGVEFLDFLGGITNILKIKGTYRSLLIDIEFDFLVDKKRLKEFDTACIEHNKRQVKVIVGFEAPKIAKYLKKYLLAKKKEANPKASKKTKRKQKNVKE